MKRALMLSLVSLAACDKPVKVDLEPSTLEIGAKGRFVKLHATPRGRNGLPFPNYDCAWSSTDEKVATVSTAQENSNVKQGHNEVTITAAGDGSAKIRCTLGEIVSDAPVVVRLVAKV